MPDTKSYQPKDFKAIMLSSTFTDLKEHRARAIETIQKLGYMPRVMEHSGAQAEADVIDTSLAMVRDAVAYIGVISLKYGQTPVDPGRNPDRLSVTELEFNEAMRLGRPIVLFIMSEDHPVKKADIEADPEKLKKLDAFRERAKRMRNGSEVNRVYELFDSLEQFSTVAAAAIGNLVRYSERTSVLEEGARQGAVRTTSNLPINIPFHFVGREDDFASIDKALASKGRRAALTGLRGVGKTTLAAAYAESRRADYRATWWIAAETESTMRADLFGLGVQLGWVAANAPEEEAVSQVLERLRVDGQDILLIYDNAIAVKELAKFLPRGGEVRIILTSTAPNWGGVATPVEVDTWPKEIGANFLMARSGRAAERSAALALSLALGGLPLAHEQAAAYCERVGVSLAEYCSRLDATPSNLLDNVEDASLEYRDGLTVAKTFALAIDEAGKRHPASEALIVYIGLLPPVPIPLYLFSEARESFGQSFSSLIADQGLDEAVAALRAFGLVDREPVADERDPSIATDCISAHRLVRQVASMRRDSEARQACLARLTRAIAHVYPSSVINDPSAWPRARRLDPIALALTSDVEPPRGAEAASGYLLNQLAGYRQGPLAAYDQVQPLLEQAIRIDERALGPDHPNTASTLNNLAYVLRRKGDLEGAHRYFMRALSIEEKSHGPDAPEVAHSLNNLGVLLRAQGKFDEALSAYERALATHDKAFGPDDPGAAAILNNLAYLLQQRGEAERANSYFERTVVICERAFGPKHPDVAISLNNLAASLQAQGKLDDAKPFFARALDIYAEVLGPNHPDTAMSLNNFGGLLVEQRDFAGALPYLEKGMAIVEDRLPADDPLAKRIAANLSACLSALGRETEATRISVKFQPKS